MLIPISRIVRWERCSCDHREEISYSRTTVRAVGVFLGGRMWCEMENWELEAILYCMILEIQKTR